MFALTYDTFYRRLKLNAEYPKVPEVLDTCIIHTPTWELRVQQFLAEGNEDVHLTIEPDGSTYTFYKLVDKVKAEV